MHRLLLLPLACGLGAVTACGATVQTRAVQEPVTTTGDTGPSSTSGPTNSSSSPSSTATTPPPSLHDPAVVATPTASPSLHDPLLRRTPTPPPPALATFHSAVSTVTTAQLGATYRAGCPVGPSGLRLLTLTFYGFDGAAHTGEIVVNASYASQVTAAFADLYAHRFPIRTMITVDHYGGSDDKSVADDNTAGFNCRAAVGGDGSYSMHAYGEAIDVDPVENPYLYDGKVDPPDGATYADRSSLRPGMAYSGGELVNAFARIDWKWGAPFGDYQHFSTNGR